jgi:hypothetical protein
MIWFTGELRFESPISPDSLFAKIRGSTERYWSHNLYGDSLVAVFAGSRVVVWRSKPGPWLQLLPRPFFLGSVSPHNSGSLLSGRFGGPFLQPVFLLLPAVFCLFIASAAGLVPALAFFALLVGPQWFLGRRIALHYLPVDRGVIESHLHRVSARPAA